MQFAETYVPPYDTVFEHGNLYLYCSGTFTTTDCETTIFVVVVDSKEAANNPSK